MPAPPTIIKTLITDIIVRIGSQLAHESNRLQSDIDAYLGAVETSGMSREAISALVFEGESVTARAFTDSFRRRIISIIDSSINRSWGDGMISRQSSESPDDQLYTWRAESGDPCPDCAGRNGDKRSLAEWQIAGLPRSGWSLCHQNCKCILDSKGSGNFNYKRKRGLG